MTNLLNETLEIIKDYGKEIDEIKFVKLRKIEHRNYCEYYMTWDDFVLQANKEYDNGYGRAEVEDDLQIVGKDWWLERHEYNGSEWWGFKSIPKKPKEYKKFNPFKCE